ncbi:isochorismate synthase [Georgenia sp. Z1491]|uniref:isochorismate synthase n=1 Tax=Georgenia sp. Z1491 TaxID=3416707 RepID=UPI003CEBA6DC
MASTFSDSSPTSSILHVPADVVRIGDRAITWRQTVNLASVGEALDADAECAGVLHAARELEPAGSCAQVDGVGDPDIDPGMDEARYVDLVKQVLTDIAGGDVRKVVTSRALVRHESPEVLNALPARLAEAYPDAWTFVVGGLVGATPELLAARTGERVRSRVLAGSLPRGSRPDTDLVAEISTSRRFAEEHAHAARSVVEGLAAVLELEERDPAPFVLEQPNIYHLATDVAGRPSSDLGLLGIVAAIHPTAAVAGTPRDTAMAIIARREAHDRGRYAGPVGWIDADGDGEIGLALRCGQVEDHSIRLFAGGGIVAGADPEDELAETVGKLRPMREALEAAAARH